VRDDQPGEEPVPLLARVGHSSVRAVRPPRQDLVYVLCAGGRWRRVRVIAWGQSGEGWAVMLRWRAVDLGWYAYDLAMVHPAEHES
jgi:hypothetical protein